MDATSAFGWRMWSGVTAPKRLTYGGKDRYPVWSADSTRVIFQSDRGGDLGLYGQSADGSAAATRLTTPAAGVSHVAQSASPDGRVLLIDVIEKDKVTLAAYRFADGSLTPFGNVSSSVSTSAMFSPDGKWVAYSTGPPAGANANV